MVKIEKYIQFLTSPGSGEPDALLMALAQAGYSSTRARRAVVQALHDSGQATPAELLASGRTHHPALGLVTVYRTLEILEGLGLVRKLHLDAGCHSYAISALAAQQADHGAHAGHRDIHSHHVICQHCNRAVEFAGCDLATVVASVETQTGYRVREHWLEMFGICPACQEAWDAEAREPGDTEKGRIGGCINQRAGDS